MSGDDARAQDRKGVGQAVLPHLLLSARSRAVREFTPLYNSFHDELLKFARMLRRSDGRIDHEAMVNDAFDAHFRELEKTGVVYTFTEAKRRLRGRVRNLVLKECAKVGRRDAIMGRIIGGVSATLAAHISLPNISGIRRWMRPHDQVEREEFVRRLLDTLETLPPRQREVFILRHGEGMNAREIGDLLGIAPGTVRASLSDALATLAERLGDLGFSHTRTGGAS